MSGSSLGLHDAYRSEPEVSVCANCIHVRDGDMCASRIKASKPARVHPVSGRMLPEVVSMANCNWRNEQGTCADFERRIDRDPVTGIAADLRDEPPTRGPPPSPERAPPPSQTESQEPRVPWPLSAVMVLSLIICVWLLGTFLWLLVTQ